jgi:hypothetical protein
MLDKPSNRHIILAISKRFDRDEYANAAPTGRAGHGLRASSGSNAENHPRAVNRKRIAES